VLVPQLYLLTPEAAGNITRFVESGGTALVSAFTDVVDETDSFRDGGYLVGLRDLLGVTVEDFGALAPPASAGGRTAAEPTTTNDQARPGQSFATVECPFGEFRGEYLSEEIHIQTAQTVGTFADGRLKGQPAVTSHRYGQGKALYVATIPDDHGMQRVVSWAIETSCVTPEVRTVRMGRSRATRRQPHPDQPRRLH
jgi:beta-galactosidase